MPCKAAIAECVDLAADPGRRCCPLLAGNARPQLARWLALVVALATLRGEHPAVHRLRHGQRRHAVRRAACLDPAPTTSSYHLGVDGISVALIGLTTLTTALVLIGAWRSIDKRVSQYFAAFLILEGLMIGVFAAMDAMLFYVFFEAMLIPMFIIIGVWGGPRRVYASVKFFLYTFLGSVFMLVGADLPVPEGRQLAARGHGRAAADDDGAGVDVLRVPDRVRGQGADVPGAHVVAGCARRGADRRLGDPGGDHAEDRRIRLPALHACRSCRMPATNAPGW